jgi:pimeloyl-ACP methyl ester carboxylesterase
VVCLALSADYRCLALDLRGHGDSEWSPNMEYGLDFHSGDLGALVDHLGLQRVALTGMSLGGLASIAYTADHKDRVAALTIVDVAPTVSAAGANRIKDFMLGTDEGCTLDDYIERALQFNPRRSRDMLRLSLLHNLRALPGGRWIWKYDRRHFGRRDLYDADHRRLQLWTDVSGLECPTLVIRGANSEMLTEDDAQQLATSLPDGRLVTIPEAGHTVQGDNPRGLISALTAFLTSTAPWA